LVIADHLIEFNSEDSVVSDAWMKLRDNVFSKTDHCLELVDPIGLLLDRISEAARPDQRLVRYFLRRLPETSDDSEKPEADALLHSTFSAFKARRGGQSAWYAEKVKRALAYRRAMTPPNPTTWISEIAVKTGLPLATITDMAASLREAPIALDASVRDSVEWLMNWLTQSEARVQDLFTPESVGAGLNPQLVTLQEVRTAHVAEIKERIFLWISGVPLTEIEVSLGGTTASGKLKKARTFIKDVVTEVSYIGGLLAQVARGLQINENPDYPISVALGTLGACVKEGFDDPWKLAFRYEMGSYSSRVAAHALAGTLTRPPEQLLSFPQIREFVRTWRESNIPGG
jgi:hypothetical protein